MSPDVSQIQASQTQSTQQAQSALSSAVAASAQTTQTAATTETADTTFVTFPQTKDPVSSIQSVNEVVEEQVAADEQELVSSAMEQLNDLMDTFNKGVTFDIYDDTGQFYVKVINRDTQEVIKTLPAEEMMAVMSRIDDAIGMLIDEQG